MNTTHTSDSSTSVGDIYENKILGKMTLSDTDKIKIVHERYEFVYSQYIANLLEGERTVYESREINKKKKIVAYPDKHAVYGITYMSSPSLTVHVLLRRR